MSETPVSVPPRIHIDSKPSSPSPLPSIPKKTNYVWVQKCPSPSPFSSQIHSQSSSIQPNQFHIKVSNAIVQGNCVNSGLDNSNSKAEKMPETPVSVPPRIHIDSKPSSSPSPLFSTPKKTNYVRVQMSPHTSSLLSQSSSIQPDQFSFDPPPPPFNQNPLCTKPTLSPSFSSEIKSLSPSQSSPTNHQTKTKYVWVQKNVSSSYMIPKNIKRLIRKGIKPRVLDSPLSPQTYKDFFAALLYAEDFYIEKWNNFQLKNVSLELHPAAIYDKSNKNKNVNECDQKDFVAFDLDSVPERRPFLLSRDFVFVRPLGSTAEPFQGIIYRVVKSNRILIEFGDDFHCQHHSSLKYDIRFSFNRVCLKRAHQAIAAASDHMFKDFLFPDYVSRESFHTSSPPLFTTNKLDRDQKSVICQVLSLRCPPPYLIKGGLSVTNKEQLSRTGLVVQEAVLQIYQTFPACRILISAPLNSTCDLLMRSLKKEIPESNMFRANAAFRELDQVPSDILPSCLYKEECFTCPSLQNLQNFKVILSTYISSFRLCNEGLTSGHFSHIFLVDASSVTEPEIMVTLAHLAGEKTVLVITGAPNNRSRWVRSDISRKNGLTISYFERLSKSKSYSSLDPMFITRLGGQI